MKRRIRFRLSVAKSLAISFAVLAFIAIAEYNPAGAIQIPGSGVCLRRLTIGRGLRSRPSNHTAREHSGSRRRIHGARAFGRRVWSPKRHFARAHLEPGSHLENKPGPNP